MQKTSASIRPGEEWLDTDGRPIHAHGGSVLVEDGVFYWYGENKEFTTGDDETWHWGIRCYSSTDLYNWEDRGLIIEPVLDDRESPLHPAQHVDRPHIAWNAITNRYVCWLKIMGSGQGVEQTATVLTSPNLLGPYEVSQAFMLPQGLTMGDFDIATDGSNAYLYFEHPHSELICSDLSPDFTRADGTISRHFTGLEVPDAREAPAYFQRAGKHYLVTSGTSGYFPNRTEIAVADSPHGPWTSLGSLHVADESATSFRSQISSVFRHPGKADLFIAVADRWLPERSEADSDFTELFARYFAGDDSSRLDDLIQAAGRDLERANTSIARYVWLPITFDGEQPQIHWRDEWTIDDFD